MIDADKGTPAWFSRETMSIPNLTEFMEHSLWSRSR
jgi:hypothetical protein